MQWYGGENEIIRGHFETSESDDKWAKCQGSHNEDGYVVLYIINGKKQSSTGVL